MRAITVEAAYSIQLDHRIGSITPGKDANLTILETSPWDTAPEKLKDIKVWGTMLEGRLQPVPATLASARTRDVQVAAVSRAGVSEAAVAQLAKVIGSHAHVEGE